MLQRKKTSFLSWVFVASHRHIRGEVCGVKIPQGFAHHARLVQSEAMPYGIACGLLAYLLISPNELDNHLLL